MQPVMYEMADLFAQLGLPNAPHEIAQFIALHRGGSDNDARLPDAPYWTPSQAAFLREALRLDSNWSGVVDQLSSDLQPPPPLLEDSHA